MSAASRDILLTNHSFIQIYTKDRNYRIRKNKNRREYLDKSLWIYSIHSTCHFSHMSLREAMTGSSSSSFFALSPLMKREMKKGVAYNMKVVLRGKRRVGKTALLTRLCGYSPPTSYTPDTSISARTLRICGSGCAPNEGTKVDIWDVPDLDAQTVKAHAKTPALPTGSSSIASSEVEKTMQAALEECHAAAYNQCRCAMLMMDASQRDSLLYVKEEVRRVPADAHIIFVVNCVDVSDPTREISRKELDELCRSVRRTSTSFMGHVFHGNVAAVPREFSAAASWVEVNTVTGMGIQNIIWALDVPNYFTRIKVLEERLQALYENLSLRVSNYSPKATSTPITAQEFTHESTDEEAAAGELATETHFSDGRKNGYQELPEDAAPDTSTRAKPTNPVDSFYNDDDNSSEEDDSEQKKGETTERMREAANTRASKKVHYDDNTADVSSHMPHKSSTMRCAEEDTGSSSTITTTTASHAHNTVKVAGRHEHDDAVYAAMMKSAATGAESLEKEKIHEDFFDDETEEPGVEPAEAAVPPLQEMENQTRYSYHTSSTSSSSQDEREEASREANTDGSRNRRRGPSTLTGLKDGGPLAAATNPETIAALVIQMERALQEAPEGS